MKHEVTKGWILKFIPNCANWDLKCIEMNCCPLYQFGVEVLLPIAKNMILHPSLQKGFHHRFIVYVPNCFLTQNIFKDISLKKPVGLKLPTFASRLYLESTNHKANVTVIMKCCYASVTRYKFQISLRQIQHLHHDNRCPPSCWYNFRTF